MNEKSGGENMERNEENGAKELRLNRGRKSNIRNNNNSAGRRERKDQQKSATQLEETNPKEQDGNEPGRQVERQSEQLKGDRQSQSDRRTDALNGATKRTDGRKNELVRKEDTLSRDPPDGLTNTWISNGKTRNDEAGGGGGQE